MQGIVGRARASGCRSNLLLLVTVQYINKDKVQFLAEQTSSVHEEEQDNLVAIFFVSSYSVGIAGIHLLFAVSHT